MLIAKLLFIILTAFADEFSYPTLDFKDRYENADLIVRGKFDEDPVRVADIKQFSGLQKDSTFKVRLKINEIFKGSIKVSSLDLYFYKPMTPINTKEVQKEGDEMKHSLVDTTRGEEYVFYLKKIEDKWIGKGFWGRMPYNLQIKTVDKAVSQLRAIRDDGITVDQALEKFKTKRDPNRKRGIKNIYYSK